MLRGSEGRKKAIAPSGTARDPALRSEPGQAQRRAAPARDQALQAQHILHAPQDTPGPPPRRPRRRRPRPSQGRTLSPGCRPCASGTPRCRDSPAPTHPEPLSSGSTSPAAAGGGGGRRARTAAAPSPAAPSARRLGQPPAVRRHAGWAGWAGLAAQLGWPSGVSSLRLHEGGWAQNTGALGGRDSDGYASTARSAADRATLRPSLCTPGGCGPKNCRGEAVRRSSEGSDLRGSVVITRRS